MAKNAAYKAGLLHYTRGEFKESVAQFQKALASGRITRDEKMKSHKFIGLSLFTLGRLPEAEQNFVRCLTLDRTCSIKKDEALDESVLPFFKQVKERIENPASGPRTSVAAAAASAPPPTPAPSPAPTPPAAAAGAAKGVTAGTRILIQTNVKEAQVLIDGILAGPSGATLSATPGTTEVEVEAEGYTPRKLRLQVSKNQLNTFKVDLQPIGPSKEELAAAAREAKDKALFRADALDRERARGESSRDRKLSGSQRQRDERSPAFLPREDQEAMSSKEDESLFGEDERRSERRSDRDGRYRDDDARDNDYDFPPLRGDSKPGKIPISFFHLMPFGIGQIYNDDYLLAAGFFGIQVYSIYSILSAQENIQRSTDNLTTGLARNDLSPEQLDAFALEVQIYNQEQEAAQNQATLILGGSYALGVLHALIFRPDMPSKRPIPGFSWQVQPDAFETGGARLVMDWNF